MPFPFTFCLSASIQITQIVAHIVLSAGFNYPVT